MIFSPSAKYIIIVIIMMAFSVVSFRAAYVAYRFSKDFKSWVATKGVITRSEITTGPVGDMGSQYRSSGYTWRLFVEYSYNINGDEYHAKNIDHNSDHIAKFQRDGDIKAPVPEKIARFMELHGQGDHVDIFYDPRNPSRACLLEPKLTGKIMSATIMGFVFIVATSLFFRFGLFVKG